MRKCRRERRPRQRRRGAGRERRGRKRRRKRCRKPRGESGGGRSADPAPGPGALRSGAGGGAPVKRAPRGGEPSGHPRRRLGEPVTPGAAAAPSRCQATGAGPRCRFHRLGQVRDAELSPGRAVPVAAAPAVVSRPPFVSAGPGELRAEICPIRLVTARRPHWLPLMAASCGRAAPRRPPGAPPGPGPAPLPARRQRV